MKYLVLFLALVFSMASRANSDVARELQDVFSESEVIVAGVIVGSSLAECNGESPARIYEARILQTMKGKLQKGKNIRACGPAPILLAEQYILAGRVNSQWHLVFEADAAILFVPFDRYYRLIAYDSPYTKSDRGNAYSVGIDEADFSARFGKMLDLKSTVDKRGE